MNLYCAQISFDNKRDKINNFFEFVNKKISVSNYRDRHEIVHRYYKFISFVYAQNGIVYNNKFCNFYEYKKTIVVTIGIINNAYNDIDQVVELYRKSKYEKIVSDFKGNYILFFLDCEKKRVTMIKSPICSYNCYYMLDDDKSILISSDLNYFMEYYKNKYLPNSEYIKRYLASYFNPQFNLNNYLTPFENVYYFQNGTVSSFNKSIQKHNNLMDCQPYTKHRFQKNEAVFLYDFWTP